jgi:hypothetical protein
MRALGGGLAVLVGLGGACEASAQVAPKNSAQLVATTQALLDAVTAGDSAVWAPHLAPEWFTYTLTPDIRLQVTAGDSGLSLESAGRPAHRLYALDDCVFIRHGVRGFWVFERDSAGGFRTLVNWRDNNAVVWRRVAGP